jgi:probable F420-dependent oxidoreductase
MAALRPFRFGVVGITGTSRRDWIAKAQRAEALGYSTFLVWDHLNDQLAPLVALMAAADATTKLRIGTYVLANDFRHPAVLAKELATLDLLSEGRVEFGIGAGWNREEFTQAGLPFHAPAVRVQRLQESVQIIKGLWGDGPLTFQGQHYTVVNYQSYPQPYQLPYPPIMIGGARKQMLAFAAREATIVAFATKVHPDGTHDFAASTGPALARRVGWVREAAGERFATLELQIHVGGVVLTEDREQSAAQLAPTVQLTPTQLLDCVQALVGTEDQIVATLQQRRIQYGISYIGIDERFMEVLAPIVARLAGA